MSRTIRNHPKWIFRHPRGYRQAIIGEARKGAVPPHAYDDIRPGHEVKVYKKYKKTG
jgi:hypothetical protein